MKKLFHFLFFLLLPLVLLAQEQAKVDSLKNAFGVAKHDTLKVKALYGLAWQYFYPQPRIALNYGAEMIELSKKINYRKGILDGYNLFGVLAYSNTQYDSAILWFNKTAKLSSSNKYYIQRNYALNYSGHSFRLLGKFDKADSCFSILLATGSAMNDTNEMAKGYKALAVNAHTKGSYLAALQYYLKADSLLGSTVNIDKAEILQNIGIIYHALENIKAEKEYYKRALKVYEEMNDEYGINALALSLGAVEIENKNYEKAKAHLLKALSYFESIQDPGMTGEIQYLLGQSYFFSKQFTTAKTYFTDAIETLKDIPGTNSLNQAFRGLGEAYAALDEDDKALVAYEQAHEQAKRGDIRDITNIMQAQAALYFKMANYKKAYKIQKEQQVLLDSVNAIKSAKVIHEIEAKYQNEKKQQQIELLEAQNQLREQEKDTERNIFIAGALIAFILITVLYFLFKINKRAHKKLSELDALKSRFFANISHEFRTPLTLISGPIEQKLHHEKLNEQERADFEMINRNAKQLLGLVDQLLDLSRIESGGYPLKIEKGDITELLLSLTSSFEYPASQKDLTYEVSILPPTGETWFDRDAIQKITVNLLSNAFKYTPEKGTISFSAEAAGEKLVITCKNSGPGIPMQNQQKIFDRFYQQNGEVDGAGIGLALVKELTDLLKGSIRVSSIAGQSTTFKVMLPRNKEAFPNKIISPSAGSQVKVASSAEPVLREVREYPFEDIKEEKPILLIVEDNKDIVRFIKNILQKEYNILEAYDGEKGIAAALTHIPDLIISDVMMPVKDGIALCKTLKSDERTSHIPILLLTAKAGDENKLIGFEMGADDYITKPFNSELLKIRITKLIAIRKQLQERFSQEVILKPKEIAITSADQLFLEKVQYLLDERLTDSSLSADSFSKELGMSRMQLHRKLKGLTGLSANHFIRMYRIKLAATLLTNPGTNISEVGYMVGFSNPSYFAKCFKDFYKCTPSVFVEDQKKW